MKRLAAVCLSLAAVSGCGAQEVLLGTTGSYLFTAMDALATPGEQIDLRAQVRAGDFLQGKRGYAVRFYRDGRLYKVAETDGEGIARASYAPAAAGDSEFVAELAPVGVSGDLPEPRKLLVACRPPDTPLVVVDLDKTVVATGFETVLVGDPVPMEQSQQVLAALAGSRTLVYLTHRPDYFSIKSKDWLARHGYPRGPLLLSTVGGFFQGSGEFKSAMIAGLKKRFTKIEIGIGDKVSDAQAYHDNGLRSFLIFQVPADAPPETYDALVAELGGLDEKVQVVTHWRQVAQALAGEASFPRSAMQKTLGELAEQARAKAKAAPAAGGAQ